MGIVILVLVGVLAAFILTSLIISALHFLYWIAVLAMLAVLAVGAMRLAGRVRRWSRQ